MKLKNDQVLACVYIVQDEPYILYPKDDRHKSWIRMEDVKAIAESSRRLPARFANEIYRAGEFRMGGTVFTVVFSDDSRECSQTGNAVDFIGDPEEKGPSDVVAVKPHERIRGGCHSCPEYYWCLYSGSVF